MMNEVRRGGMMLWKGVCVCGEMGNKAKGKGKWGEGRGGGIRSGQIR